MHVRSTARTGERVVGGPSTGLLGLGDEVTFEAVHLGRRWWLGARITRFEPPHVFVDEQVRGPFRMLVHVHEFQAANGATLMVDTFRWASPFGLLGRIADTLFVKRHLRELLAERGQFIKWLAETAVN